ncbi:MAG: radical SAM protein, partial [Chloroflexi bacterium]|nr:radical SAM protein [Chloroflexota bacterium]
MPRDYVFRYKLRPDGKDGLRGPSDFIRTQLEELLDIVVPMEGNREVKIDGFRFMNDDSVYQLFDGATPVSGNGTGPHIIYEPRIELIRRQLEAILAMVELEQNERPVRVNGFRLKDLKDWCVTSTPDPNDIIDYLGARCNCDCVMCCNKGNPTEVALNIIPRSQEQIYQEIRTRIRYFSPGKGTALFPCPPGVVYDVLAHPRSLETLRSLRRKSPLPFRLHTNGRALTGKVITELARLKPVYLYLSLNTCSPSRRKKLMIDSRPETAIGSLALLRDAGIPYAANIVPWPVDTAEEMLDDLATTIDYADRHMAHLIEVNLPGYSAHFSRKELFEFPGLWASIVTRVREMRKRVASPVVIMPCMFEENRHEKRLGLSRVMGLVRNSPAALAGVRKGDVIVGINGIAVRDRPQTRVLLSAVAKSDVAQVDLRVKRGRAVLDIPTHLQEYSYPYSKQIDGELGIVFLGTGLANYVEKLMEIARHRQARRVLFLSSYLVKPAFEQQLSQAVKPDDVKIDIEVP